ncbi:hypothetical protein [Streptomyces drozdowiczii]|uniref:Uncharacterized protein n=1 Tax=Streptomyces drozdowiczii TaxID=202862 RepID=A0ABY6PUK4_9ACTN|nr:hypothetical protein [Streptomyces drozdowiczii]MCX0244191.1 hypothetical protein [Streptomyces drozdowiczii]UZK56000.1 hypothetical protein NEH16_19450 [Streptomyces drozdowiczii]
MPEGPEDIGPLVRLFDALGAEDPEGWAESEAEEGLPQLARFRLLRMVWQDIDAWSTTATDWVAAYRRDGAAGGAVERAVRLGLTVEDLGEIAREVARETAFAMLQGLDDPDRGDEPDEVAGRLPGWFLGENSAHGGPTGRILNALHEDLNEAEPQTPTSRIGSRTGGDTA